ncbi:MAG TPA: F0F1 ATP synthase subunit B [Candidatus Saccharimonadia bacterium]|nr:F0F1 ATP synthase subunit B [Candidatus Saccharimonadia bacterium]
MIFLAESGGIGSLFTALGLNVQSLVLNTLAFLVIVWVLGKFVYPSLIKALDAKKDELEAAVRLEREAKEALEQASKQAQGVVAEARASAAEILDSAKADATAQIETARTRATEQGERLLAEAKEQVERDVLAARRELKAETAKLVAGATAAVLGEKLDSEHDRTLIARSLEGK